MDDKPVCVLERLIQAPPAGPNPPATPIKTTKFFLPFGGGWIDVGRGPLEMTSPHGIVYVIGDETPDLPPDDGFRLAARVIQPVSLASHVWAASRSDVGADLYVAGPQ